MVGTSPDAFAPRRLCPPYEFAALRRRYATAIGRIKIVAVWTRGRSAVIAGAVTSVISTRRRGTDRGRSDRGGTDAYGDAWTVKAATVNAAAIDPTAKSTRAKAAGVEATCAEATSAKCGRVT